MTSQRIKLCPIESGQRRYWLPVVGLVALSLQALSVAKPESDSNRERPIAFQAVAIDRNGPASCWGKAAGDVNGDGRIDLLVGGIGRQGLYWYENPGWTKHAIDSSASISTDIEVIDLNKDGTPDVVTITYDPGGLIWYEHGGAGWKLHTIAEDTLHDIEVVDLDGDGKLDVVGRNQGSPGGDTLFLYKQQTIDSWQRVTIVIPSGEGLLSADVNEDGKPDVIINGFWYENTGHINTWSPHVYSSVWTWPNAYIAVGDINGDNRTDIVLSPSEAAGQYYRISWFEAPVDRSVEWKEHVIQDNVECVHHFIGVADFDQNGRLDVATAMMQQGRNPEIQVFLNTSKGESWQVYTVAKQSSHSMKIVDLDGNGRPSLFGANWNDRPTTVWLWKPR